MKNILANRRVGTLTLGVVLIGSGTAGLLHLIDPTFMDFNYYIRWWPVILILLGIEVLLAWIFSKGDKLRYDGWAVVLMVCMLVFAGLMAATELALDHVEFFDYFF
ncbi:MAG: hypothetical protein E7224_03250 [Clostridiales bacterium]|nr:hypothetical protein [Clostridiales bacterium]